MASEPPLPGCAALELLPNELFLQILEYLDSTTITRLFLVSRTFYQLCLDNQFWRARCYDESAFKKTLRHRRNVIRVVPPSFSITPTAAAAAAAAAAMPTPAPTPLPMSPVSSSGSSHPLTLLPPQLRQQSMDPRRRWLQDLANWDPVYPGERVSWYDEYIHRHGRATVNWMQQPRYSAPDGEPGALFATVETDVRGAALFRENVTRPGPVMAVAPVDDGSVYLWDVSGDRGARGSVIARSKIGLLFGDTKPTASTARSHRIDSGVAESVSVCHQLGVAFIAVQSQLITVDLGRLEIINHHPFPSSITCLSHADIGVSLSVGTSSGVCLYDYRDRLRAAVADADSERVAPVPPKTLMNQYSILFDKTPLPPCSPTQPGAITIAHVPRPGAPDVMTDHLYVGGRFASIAHFDRRMFPRMVDSLYSGARLASLACLPYPYSPQAMERRRRAELTADEVERSKLEPGCTLVAAGDYQTKGSLELYGLTEAGLDAPPARASAAADTGYRNRQSAAASRLLSVAPHGSRIMVSDASGHIKWFERDGSVRVREVRIGYQHPHQDYIINGQVEAYGFKRPDGLARKVIATHSGLQLDPSETPETHNDDDVLFWTGDKLGLVTFSRREGFDSDNFEDEGEVLDAELVEREAEYTGRMREALARHADEVPRLAQVFGVGAP